VTFFFKTVHPGLHGAGAGSEEGSPLGPIQTGTDQQDSVKTMVVSGFLRPADLYCGLHELCILDLKLAQSSLPAKAEQAIGYMRNYL
jgi:hypothetical protein